MSELSPHDSHAATVTRLRAIEKLQRYADEHRKFALETDKEAYPETYATEMMVFQILNGAIKALEEQYQLTL